MTPSFPLPNGCRARFSIGYIGIVSNVLRSTLRHYEVLSDDIRRPRGPRSGGLRERQNRRIWGIDD
jgi:hypothetical protein